MKYRTVEERVGELLGPVDWSYDFLSHFGTRCGGDEQRKAFCDEAIKNLRLLSKNPDQYEATTDGGWPRCGWGKVVEVGMYDGWPYWRPVPSVAIESTFGIAWHSFSAISSIRPIERKAP